MEKFLKKVVEFGAFFIGAVMAVIFVEAIYLKRQDIYMNEYANKICRLRDLNHKKLVILGGSSAAYGIDSRKLQEATGLAVANHGLALSLGIQLPLNDAKAFCNAGDVILLMPEYENFFNFAYGNPGDLSLLFLLNPNMYSQCETRHYIQILQSAPSILKGFTNGIMGSVLTAKDKGYTLSSTNFNCYGDEEKHCDYDTKEILDKIGINADLDKDYVKRFVKEIKILRDSGIVVHLLPPPIYTTYKDQIEDHIEELQTELKRYGEEFMIDPDSMVFAKDEMFDAVYHLNRKGIDRHMSIIIDYLNRTHTVK